jgi:DNA-binding protein HU-beta
VNKADLIVAVDHQLGVGKKAAGEAVDAVVDAITRSVVAGERVAISGFGVFEKATRNARTARNPRTGAVVKLKKTSVPKFKAGQGFKDVVSGARKLAKAGPSAAAGAAGAAAGAASRATGGVKKAATKTAPAKKAPATAKKAPAKKAPTKKTAAATKTTAKKAPAKKTTAKRTAKKA